MQTSRVHALLELANVKDRVDEIRFARMLDIGARSLRSHKPLMGTLSRLEHGAIVYEGIAWTGKPGHRPGEEIIQVGVSVPLGDTAQSLIYANGKAQAWNDIQSSTLATLHVPQRTGIRSMIGCTMQIGPRVHFLMYSSPETMTDDPYDDEDLAFVNVTGRMFAGTMNQLEYIERLRHHMEHDGLTGLVNRVQFRNAIRQEIESGKLFAIGLVNLDRFRQINEIHGQMIADEALVEVASELDAISSNDLVARMSGDEFGILARDVPKIDDIGASVDAYLARFRQPFHTGDRDGTRMIVLAASIGWTISPNRRERAEDLLRRADVALDIAKEHGGRAAVIFNDKMERIIEQRRIEASELERAIANNEFRLLYQPTFDLATGAITGAEALIRWEHPERGLLAPAEFISAAERNGIIGGLSRWVMMQVMDDLDGSQGLPISFRCYVNLSAQNLVDFAFMTMLSDAIAEFPHLARHLGVEITETAAMLNVEQSLSSLQIIRSMGVSVAIDDFGTGYSSLSYLKHLAVDLIKIDRSFIGGLPQSEQDAALSEMMIDIGKRFNLSVLAEGIETLDQRDWLLEHGCQYGQGYLVAKPMSFSALLDFIANANVRENIFELTEGRSYAGS